MSKQPKLNTHEAAAYLGVRPNTLEIWRCKHRGPKYAKLGSRIVYDPDDLDAYFAARSISTRDTELDRLEAGNALHSVLERHGLLSELEKTRRIIRHIQQRQPHNPGG